MVNRVDQYFEYFVKFSYLTHFGGMKASIRFVSIALYL